MEPKVSLPQSHEFVNFSYPEPDQSSQCLPIQILEDPLNDKHQPMHFTFKNILV